MIVVDTSALMAILRNEESVANIALKLEETDVIAMSAGTAAEALIVALCRGAGREMSDLIDGLGIEVIAVNRGTAGRVAAAYDRWGKGRHAAALNFGDCFAYALATERGCPLLFVGADFAATDVGRAL